ncbi:MAG: hypothetical protein V4675_25085 [Verrucomicrobiota bacterium]
MRGKLEDTPEAIRRLRGAGIPVLERAYGFSLEHPDWSETGRSFAECTCENDGSIVLTALADELPPVVRFARFDVLEMADFIVSAYRRAREISDSAEIVSALRAEDSGFDYAALEARVDQWQCDFDEYWRGRSNQ